MKRVWEHIGRRRRDVSGHPFFTWLHSGAMPLEQRFVFAPLMIDFIMGFAELNKWFLSYPCPTNELERAINDHADEDRTHSRLIREDWSRLDVGDVAGWSAGKSLWWLFQSRECAVVREFGMVIMDLSVNHAEPLVRFSMMEAIEACGDVFFANTAPLAHALAVAQGCENPDFGEYHRRKETDHLRTDEATFFRSTPSAEELEQGRYVADRIFDHFLSVLDALLSYAWRATSDSDRLWSELEAEFQVFLISARARDRGDVAPQPLRPSPVSASQRPVLSLLEARVARLTEHPLLDWLRSDESASASEKLCSFVACWGVEIAGCRDFNQLVLRYRDPRTRLEFEINEWVSQLASHGALYLQDWQALGIDELLGWRMREAIGFYFLGEQSEAHRRNMASVKRYACKYREPVLRWWLMTALARSGEPLFACTEPIARSLEEERGLTLDYWGNRHGRGHGDSRRVQHERFLGEELSLEQQRVAGEMMELIFDNVESQLTLSHRVALDGLSTKRGPSWRPPRQVSDIVMLRPDLARDARPKAG